MTKEEFSEKFGTPMIGTYANGFRLAGQFPVFEFRRETELFEFNIDCRITSNSEVLNEYVSNFKNLEDDIYEIAFYFGINNTQVTSLTFNTDENLVVSFNNDTSLTFKLIDEWPEPLNLSHSIEGKHISGCKLMSDGTIQ